MVLLLEPSLHPFNGLFTPKNSIRYHVPGMRNVSDLCKGLKIKPSDFFKLVEVEYEKARKNG